MQSKDVRPDNHAVVLLIEDILGADEIARQNGGNCEPGYNEQKDEPCCKTTVNKASKKDAEHRCGGDLLRTKASSDTSEMVPAINHGKVSTRPPDNWPNDNQGINSCVRLPPSMGAVDRVSLNVIW